MTSRPFPVSKGEPVYALMGEAPATSERVVPAGNLALVPEFSHDPLLNVGFEEDQPLAAVARGKRLKGWLATPLAGGDLSVLGVQVLQLPHAMPRSGRRHAAIGYDLTGSSTHDQIITAGSSALLAQEVRNPRAGTYTVTAQVAASGEPGAYARFQSDFRCRLVLFGYKNLSKDPTKDRREFAAIEFKPPLAKSAIDYTEVKLTHRLRSQEAGASEIEMGIGIAIIVERATAGDLPVPAGQRFMVYVDDVEIQFDPRPRNDDVTV
jgi:hypothetical protein